MSIGILACCYNCADTLHECLAPWIELKDELKLVISVVSIPFAEYRDLGLAEDNTRELLNHYLAAEKIDFLVTHPEYLGEAAARNLALKPLLASGVEFVHLLDGDEVMTAKEIRAAYRFVQKMDDVCWYSTHFRNYIGDGRGYVEGFCPPRIFRAHCGNLSLNRLVWDNDFEYVRDDGVEFHCNTLPRGVIPKNVFYPRHLTWLDGEKSWRKIAYQKAHFGGICSYKCDAAGHVEFDPEYYKRIGQPVPEVVYD